MINRTKLGYRISDLIRQSGKKQGEIAHDLGADESSVSQWVNGKWTPKLEYDEQSAYQKGYEDGFREGRTRREMSEERDEEMRTE